MKGSAAGLLFACWLLFGPLPARANHDIDPNELLRRIDRYEQERVIEAALLLLSAGLLGLASLAARRR